MLNSVYIIDLSVFMVSQSRPGVNLVRSHLMPFCTAQQLAVVSIRMTIRTNTKTSWTVCVKISFQYRETM